MDFFLYILLVGTFIAGIVLSIMERTGRRYVSSSGVVLFGSMLIILLHNVNIRGANAGSLQGGFPINELGCLLPVIATLFGAMVIGVSLINSGICQRIATRLFHPADSPAVYLLLLMVVSAVFSAMFSGILVCVVAAPVLINLLRLKGWNPVPFVVPMIISCNIGSAMTLIGSPGNLVAASVIGLEVEDFTFINYLSFAVVPSLLSLVAAYPICLLLGRKRFMLPMDAEIQEPDPDRLIRRRPGVFASYIIAPAVLVLFFLPVPMHISLALGAAMILIRPTPGTGRILRKIYWPAIIGISGFILLSGMFDSFGLAVDCSDSLLLKTVEPDMSTSFDSDVPIDMSARLTPDSAVVLATVAGLLTLLSGGTVAILFMWPLLKILPGMTSAHDANILVLATSLAGNMIVFSSLASVGAIRASSRYRVSIPYFEFFRYGLPVTIFSYGALFLWMQYM